MANPNPILAELTAEVARDTDVKNSAITALNGIASRIEAAVTLALENGATAEQLLPVTDEVAAMRGSSDALAAAVAANTPAA